MSFRLVAAVTFLATLAVSGSFRWRARRAGEPIKRRQEAGGLIAMRVAVAAPLFASILVYLMRPDWMAWSSVQLPNSVRLIGAAVASAAVPAAWWVFQSIGTNVSETVLTKANHQLIITGPYAWVRHPLYATGGMLFIGIGLMAANWFILLFASLAVALISRIAVPLEERALVAKFGDDYRGYAARTGGLFPRLTRAKH